MSKIIGNTTATPNPQPDWNQTDSKKADFIKNKPTILTENNVVELISEHTTNQIQSDWNQTDETKADFIKNKPDINAAIAAIIGPDADEALDTIKEIQAVLEDDSTGAAGLISQVDTNKTDIATINETLPQKSNIIIIEG